MSEIALWPAHRQLKSIHAGELSAREAVGAALAQIDRLDPEFHAFITIRAEEVMQEAGALDERFAKGERLPLHGLPLAVKDVIPTAGIRTTFGSAEYADNVPTEDVGYVRKLKEAGALIVGKSSTPEFGAYMNTRNVFSGVTLSPWPPHRSSGGSSGGTAVAIATGMAALGIGTDLGGSVRFPAAFNGIFGLRGTPGLIPTYPNAWPFDTFAVAGPMCRTVADTDLMLRVMSGPDPRSPLIPMAPYGGIEPVEPSAVRVAWSEDIDGLFPVDQDVRDALRQARREMEAAGVTTTDAAPPLHGIRDSIIPLRSVRTLVHHMGRLEAATGLANPLLAQSIERAKEMPALDVAKAELARTKVWGASIGFFDRFDILAMPSTQMVGFSADQAAPLVIEGQDIPEALDTCLATYAITMLGWPCISVPCGFAESGEPVGLQLVAPHGREGRLLGFAQFLESAIGWTGRIPPIARTAPSAPSGR